jgi:hypothetical protein
MKAFGCLFAYLALAAPATLWWRMADIAHHETKDRQKPERRMRG